MHDARIERMVRERTAQRRARLESTIEHLRRKPLPTKFSMEFPEFGARMAELKREGAENAARQRNGEPRIKPFEATSVIALVAEAAAYKPAEYPPELDRELHRVAAEPEPVLSNEERHLVAQMLDLRRVGLRSLIEATAGAERAAELMEHPSSSVRIEAGATWLHLTFGPPEEARYPESRTEWPWLKAGKRPPRT